MTFVYDFANMLLAAVFFAFLGSGTVASIALFAIYFAAARASVNYFCEACGATQPLVVHYELFSFGILILLLVLTRRVVQGDFKNNVVLDLKFLDLVFDDARVIFLSKLWFFTLVVTSTIGYLRHHGINVVSESFYVSWCVNVIFFTVIGLAAALVSLRHPHKEEFENRIGFLFAATVDADPELKRSALKHVSEDVKKLGFVSSSTERRITVEEYSAEFEAFKASVTMKTTLINLFGDVDAKDEMNFAVIPDKFEQGKQPATIGQIVSLIVDGEERIKDGPLEISSETGAKFPELFSVGRESKSFAFKYWQWFKVGEESGYTSRRFCRNFSVKIVNRIKTGDVKVVTLLRDGTAQKALGYGEELEIFKKKDMEPSVRYVTFTFAKPPLD
ncbi:hypothetical protein LAC81_30385 [Ensifer adhaerens]|uniref:hypothetical protein n=1 Tax=Ensifer adhaerens TaxID=106592 RepID=UPI001CC07035|nr:hypothetical protein [Ensifer adhaerens]MBZ7925050.1 hypothetical protein [Ensifer adhaerens]UAX95756.1 hypothetical protein LAC78_33445 [Ensifer adhaerens]UAY04903.1 hypothetical protein LAC80_26865 [Ensifer adhaerens]UAY10335.1 hypothetical protein LAC81_30385 [Ensifer adhaerens]